MARMIQYVAPQTLTILIAVLLCGCQRGIMPPDLGPMYNRAAADHGPHRNPVIVIPGILGSRLVAEDTGEVVWGAFGGGAVNPESAAGARLIARPLTDDPTSTRSDGVRHDGALDRVTVDFFGLPLELDAYRYILGTLGVGGYIDDQLGKSGAIDYGDDHYTCFQFDYDWRLDIPANAARLHDFILETRETVRENHHERFGGDHEVRFDIVAHSMGGLLTRYMLRYGDASLPDKGELPPVTWAGAPLVERVVLVGTPNSGSAKALEDLVDGVSFSFFLPEYHPVVLGTMPSIYQLLPRARHNALILRDERDDHHHLDPMDPEVWHRFGWGLASPDRDAMLRKLLPEVDDPAERGRIADAYLASTLRRAECVAAALDQPAPTPPPGIELYLIAGDAVQTTLSLEVNPRTGALSTDRRTNGDGTVTRHSALGDERDLEADVWMATVRSPVPWRHVMFMFEDHLGLTSDPAFSDNLLYLLLEHPRVR